MPLVLISHHRGCMNKCFQQTSWSGIIDALSRSESEASLNQGPLDSSTATKQIMTSYSTMHGGHTYYCQGRGGVKVVRSKSDQGLS